MEVLTVVTISVIITGMVIATRARVRVRAQGYII